jgi:hypothetical protein
MPLTQVQGDQLRRVAYNLGIVAVVDTLVTLMDPNDNEAKLLYNSLVTQYNSTVSDQATPI